MTKPFAWSYSVLSSAETCLHRHNEIKILKNFSEGQSEEMLWGNRVHKALELRVKDRTPLPETMATYEPIVAKIIASSDGGTIDAEQKLALTIDYEPCAYFAKEVWVRVITDVTVTKKRTAVILDYKTGKPTPASAQLKLCAAATFACMPHINKITTGFLWLKNGGITSENYTREDIPGIWQEFAPRVLRLTRAIDTGVFPKNPSGLCKAHCPVTSCEHHGGYSRRG